MSKYDNSHFNSFNYASVSSESKLSCKATVEEGKFSPTDYLEQHTVAENNIATCVSWCLDHPQCTGASFTNLPTGIYLCVLHSGTDLMPVEEVNSRLIIKTCIMGEYPRVLK